MSKKTQKIQMGITWAGVAIVATVTIGYIVYIVFIYLKTPNNFVGI